METHQQHKLAESKKDAKWIEEAEKVADLQNHHEHKQASDKEKMDMQPQSGFQPPQFMGSFGFS